MLVRSLEELERAGLIERRVVSQRRIRSWLQEARRLLPVARDRVAPVHQVQAVSIAYESGLRVCLGILGVAGYRVRNAPGHHRTALEAAANLLGPKRSALVERLDTARQIRNRALYEEPPPVSLGILSQLFSDVEELIAELESRVQ